MKLRNFSTLLSAARLIGAIVVLLAISSPSAVAEPENGGCITESGHVCLRNQPEPYVGKRCVAGTSGGCEDCVVSDGDFCFYGDNGHVSGYAPSVIDP